MSNDPFRARPRSGPQVDTEGLSENAAELAQKAMPDNAGDDRAPNSDPERTDRTGDAGGSSKSDAADGEEDGEKKDQPSKKRRKS